MDCNKLPAAKARSPAIFDVLARGSWFHCTPNRRHATLYQDTLLAKLHASNSFSLPQVHRHNPTKTANATPNSSPMSVNMAPRLEYLAIFRRTDPGGRAKISQEIRSHELKCTVTGGQLSQSSGDSNDHLCSTHGIPVSPHESAPGSNTLAGQNPDSPVQDCPLAQTLHEKCNFTLAARPI